MPTAASPTPSTAQIAGVGCVFELQRKEMNDARAALWLYYFTLFLWHCLGLKIENPALDGRFLGRYTVSGGGNSAGRIVPLPPIVPVKFSWHDWNSLYEVVITL